MEWYFWIGLIGSIGIAVFTIPQLIDLIKTKNTAFINITMYCIYLVGCFCFFIGGLLLTIDNKLSSGLPLLIANGTAVTIASIIFSMKIKNLLGAKKRNISELEYCRELKKQ